MLVSHFLRERTHSRSGKPFQVSCRAMAAMEAHTWPGNVRELENAIERATLLADLPLLRVRDLPPVVQARATADDGQEEQQIAASVVPSGPRPSETPSASATPATPGTRPASSMPPTLLSLKKYGHDQELSYIQQVLACTGQDKEAAAQILEISLATLYRKLSDTGD